MKWLYNIIMTISEKLVLLFGNFFGHKVKLFRQGQKNVFKDLQQAQFQDEKVIWMHVSSLGEYEQGLPLLEQLKEKYPQYKLVLSFFSPSGYEVKKDTTPADLVVYLPIDTRKNVRNFLQLIRPEMVFFVKYDFWPNYLFELKKNNIPTFLISALFTDKHSFFKKRNAWMKKSLKAFTHFFVQDENSKKVLQNQGFDSISVTGDTRFDRVFRIVQHDEKLPVIEKFKQEQLLFIAGSTWERDEAIIISFINKNAGDFLSIIAPHNIDNTHINKIQKSLQVPHILFTDIDDNTDLSEYKVLILNTIGLLNKTYKYADIVYIGNGFGKSIHNIQEPAVFGVPIITGPNIKKFKEAIDLQELKGLQVIHNQTEFDTAMHTLLSDSVQREKIGKITKQYALKNLGASDKIMQQLAQYL